MSLLERFLDLSTVSLKICGVTTREDAGRLVSLGVDALGVNFWPRSKRFLAPEDAEWLRDLAGKILRVGVFVNEPAELPLRLVRSGYLDAVQLHGDETPEDAAPFRDAGIPFIKAIGVKTRADLQRATDYGAAAILLDAHAPGIYGGTGEVFDWEVASDFRRHHPQLPIILAGGIVPENAGLAAMSVQPAALDIAFHDAIADLDKVVKYIDLPLQHASDTVLKRMKRPGTRKSYVRLLDNIRARIPNVALRTTFIVGFPGETAEDFAELEGFITEIGFDHVGVFTYSHEEGTSAHELVDDVPAGTKKKRQNALMARQKKIVAARQKRRLGEQARMVVDGPSPEHELVMQGRLPGQAPEIDPVVYLTECDPSAFPRGSFVDVEIVGAEGYDLIARPLGF